jgi:hypothetical protein
MDHICIKKATLGSWPSPTLISNFYTTTRAGSLVVVVSSNKICTRVIHGHGSTFRGEGGFKVLRGDGLKKKN